jgi:carboxyl-terminal processing protease
MSATLRCARGARQERAQCIAYRLHAFDEGAAAAVAGELARQEARAGQLAGWVLDLRGNPGGLVNEAVELVRLVAKEGLIVQLRGRDDRQIGAHGARPEKARFAHLPLAVLVDANSWSASELTALSLQSRKVPIIGVTTPGKGVRQLYRALADGSGYKLTDARYLAPYSSPHGVGVAPDVSARIARQTLQAKYPGRRFVDAVRQYAIELVRDVQPVVQPLPAVPAKDGAPHAAGW